MSPAQQLATPGQWVAGWHSGPTPERCSGTTTNPSGVVLLCAHPSHQEPVTPAPAADEVVVPQVLATPTAFELSPAEPETDEWFAQRRGGITATDLPKILGLSGWGNALSVWLDKRGELPREEAGEAAYWGQFLEEPIAAVYESRQEDANPDLAFTVRPVGTLARVDAPWMRASPDRLVDVYLAGQAPALETGLLEVKNRNAYVASTWREGVPDDVLAQVVWQILVTGLPWCDVAVLIGGNRLVIHRVTLDDPGMPEVADLCRREAERVWGHVQDGTPPHVDADEVLLDLLHRMYPDRTGQRELLSHDTARAQFLLDLIASNKADVKALTIQNKNSTAELVQLLDDAETAIGDDGGELFSYRAIHRSGYTVAPTTYRQLRTPRRNS